jgi:outer membrane protein assembly factor BamB
MPSHTFLSSLVFVTLLSGSAAAGDWPGWRGPKGDGIASDSNVPISWSATENLAWQTVLPGAGRSSPIVVGTRVFVTAGDNADLTRRVLCLDAAKGAVLWNTAVHRGEPGQMHKFNTSASSTPACDGQRVYSVFVDDRAMQVVAVDMEGRIVWSKSPGAFLSQHGFAASPVLFGEGVIVNGQQDGAAFIVMLHGATGDEIWRYQPAVNLRSFSTPLLTTYNGELQLIVSGSTQTIALNPATGERIWSIGGPAEKFVSTPSVGHGLVFSFGGSPEKKAMAFRPGGARELSEDAVAWRLERAMPYVPTPILVGDFLHVVNDQGIYTCLEPRTGRALSTGRKFGPVYSSPVAVGDRVFFFEDSGACTVIVNKPGFEILARNDLGEGVYTTPAIADESLFVRTETRLIRIAADQKSGVATKGVIGP